MIVTIDGPAGAGKSTAARRLAERLGFDFLDTGAMYRAVTLAAMRAGIAPDDPALDKLLDELTIAVVAGKTLLDGVDVSAEIRTPEVTSQVRHFADHRAVRELLTRCQREFAAGRNLVTEGRDQGTVVFPHAECKIYLVASAEQRARRRQADFALQGRQVSLQVLIEEQERRDMQDANRALAPLKPADDAIQVDTTDLDLAGVLDRLEAIARERIR